MVVNPTEGETNLRTFNTAKKFSDEILFPLMLHYKRFQRQANYGHEDLEKATLYDEQFREISRFNGLKAMNDTCLDLIKAISSTVKLKGNKEENEQLEKLKTTTIRVKDIFAEEKHRFFKETFRENKVIEVTDREFFEKIREIVDTCYVNTEILMTRNKLLFADSNDEYMSDPEIMEQIKKEYTEM